MKNKYLVVVCFVAIVAFIAACSKLEPKALANDELLDGPVAGAKAGFGARWSPTSRDFRPWHCALLKVRLWVPRSMRLGRIAR